jgi:hypothetical protein
MTQHKRIYLTHDKITSFLPTEDHSGDKDGVPFYVMQFKIEEKASFDSKNSLTNPVRSWLSPSVTLVTAVDLDA